MLLIYKLAQRGAVAVLPAFPLEMCCVAYHRYSNDVSAHPPRCGGTWSSSFWHDDVLSSIEVLLIVIPGPFPARSLTCWVGHGRNAVLAALHDSRDKPGKTSVSCEKRFRIWLVVTKFGPKDPTSTTVLVVLNWTTYKTSVSVFRVLHRDVQGEA
jgi:hypothetical protein